MGKEAPRPDPAYRKYVESIDLVNARRLGRFRAATLAERFSDRLRFALRYQLLEHYWNGPPAWRLKLRARSQSDRVLPDFACVGAIKSGTSALAVQLFRHPSILAPFAKEVFADDVESWRAFYPTVREMAATRARTGSARTGYFTPWMHHLPWIDAYTAKVPDAKVILFLRNPVERAYSHYKWELFIGGPAFARRPSFASYAAYVDTALDCYPNRAPTACGFSILHSGIYAPPVSRWLERVGRDRMLVLTSEEYFADEGEALRRICGFLEIPEIAYERGPRVNANPLACPPHTDEARSRVADFYAPRNDELYRLLGRDLGWA